MLHKLKQRFGEIKPAPVEPEVLKVSNFESLENSKIENLKTFAGCKTGECSAGWKMFNDPTWRCLKCQPPPNKSIIELVDLNGTVRPPLPRGGRSPVDVDVRAVGSGEAAGSNRAASEALSTPGSSSADATLVDSYMLNAFVPVCLNCHSQIYVERHWSDGAVDMTCWVCKKPTDGKPRPELIKVRESKELEVKPESDGE